MRFSVRDLQVFSEDVFIRAGMSKDDASFTSMCLARSEARGFSSHGFTHVIDIVRRIKSGTIRCAPSFSVDRTAASSMRIDADHAVGMVSAGFAMERCMECARETGIAMAAVYNSNTYGFGGVYPEMAAESGMIGFAFTNAKAYVAPFGGSSAVLGTNPITVAVPSGKYGNIVVDMATAIAAINKIRLAKKTGKEIPHGWAIGRDGRETLDPTEALLGAVLPSGEHKGYALALLGSILSFALAGGDIDSEIPRAWLDYDTMCNFGAVFGAIDISKFMPLSEFKSRVDRLCDEVKSIKPVEGVSEVLLPGERGNRRMHESLRSGVEISDEVYDDLKKVSEEYGVPIPDSLSAE